MCASLPAFSVSPTWALGVKSSALERPKQENMASICSAPYYMHGVPWDTGNAYLTCKVMCNAPWIGKSSIREELRLQHEMQTLFLPVGVVDWQGSLIAASLSESFWYFFCPFWWLLLWNLFHVWPFWLSTGSLDSAALCVPAGCLWLPELAEARRPLGKGSCLPVTLSSGPGQTAADVCPAAQEVPGR